VSTLALSLIVSCSTPGGRMSIEDHPVGKGTDEKGPPMNRTQHTFRRLLGVVAALALIASALVVLEPISSSAAPLPAQLSCTDNWTNVAGGDWTLPSNWSEGTVPTISDVACITAPGTYTVTIAATDPAQNRRRPQPWGDHGKPDPQPGAWRLPHRLWHDH
jgi:hypothetical protein